MDSSVVAVLLHEAIGEQPQCVFVDHGLLPKNEAGDAVRLLRDHDNISLVHADASELFLKALAGVTDPETKRKTSSTRSSARSSRPGTAPTPGGRCSARSGSASSCCSASASTT